MNYSQNDDLHLDSEETEQSTHRKDILTLALQLFLFFIIIVGLIYTIGYFFNRFLPKVIKCMN